jgi:hypothetical protein
VGGLCVADRSEVRLRLPDADIGADFEESVWHVTM